MYKRPKRGSFLFDCKCNAGSKYGNRFLEGRVILYRKLKNTIEKIVQCVQKLPFFSALKMIKHQIKGRVRKGAL